MNHFESIDVFLFDWGDTLMVDFPDKAGKMCTWDHVEAVPGARECLRYCSERGNIFIATGAADSTADEIQQAFKRVGLDHYIAGYFCKHNTGYLKPDVRFYESILRTLKHPPEKIVMIGDCLEKDILPCRRLGVRTVLFDPVGNENANTDPQVVKIASFKEFYGQGY